MMLRVALFVLMSWLVAFQVHAADLQKGFDALDKGDLKTALEEWLPLAEQGDAEAQYRVGTIVYNGIGDKGQAHLWLQRASEQGHVSAMLDLLSNLDFHQTFEQAKKLGFNHPQVEAKILTGLNRVRTARHRIDDALNKRDVLEKKLTQAIDYVIETELGTNKGYSVVSVHIDNTTQVERLTVAVLVDGIYRQDGATGKRRYHPRSNSELERLVGIIRDAIDYDSQRGDIVELINMPFSAEEQTAQWVPMIVEFRDSLGKTYFDSAIERRLAYEQRMVGQITNLLERTIGTGKARAAVSVDFDKGLKVLRQSAVVVVDGSYRKHPRTGKRSYVPRGDDEMELLATLVKAAIGYRANGGDVIDLINMPFAQGPRWLSTHETKKKIRRNSYEKRLSQTVEELIESVAGKGNVHAMVSAPLYVEDTTGQTVKVFVNDPYLPNKETGEFEYRPRPQDELDLYAIMVRGALGFKEDRGDSVEIVRHRFQ